MATTGWGCWGPASAPASPSWRRAHDPRVKAAALNHVSMYFGDVVWTGLSTRHVQRGLSQEVSQDELRTTGPSSAPPVTWTGWWGRSAGPAGLTSCDTTFLPVYSRQVVEAFHQLGLKHEERKLPAATTPWGSSRSILWTGSRCAIPGQNCRAARRRAAG